MLGNKNNIYIAKNSFTKDRFKVKAYTLYAQIINTILKLF